MRGTAGRGLIAGFAAALAFSATPAFGQGYDAEVRIDQLQPPSAGSPFTRAEGPHDDDDVGVGYAFRLVGDYAFQPLRSRVSNLTGKDTDTFLVEHAFLMHLGASLIPAPWLLFEVNFPFAVFEDGSDETRVPQQSLKAGSAHVGDARMGFMIRPYESEVVDVSFGSRVWFPTGQPQAYLGGNNDFARWELVPAIAGETDALLYGCTLGLAPLFFAGRDGDRLAASCALQFKLNAVVAAGIEPHLAVFSHAGGLDPSAQTPGLDRADIAAQFEPLAALALSIGDFKLNLAGGFGVGGAPGTAGARASMMVTYVGSTKPVRVVGARENDRDLDGIDDAYDACPDEAGTKEQRGCPDERDLDGDGILEGDACPEAAGARYDDERANGCPDRDNDHLADPVDACPKEPGDAEDGCPKYARLRKGQFVIEPPLFFQDGRAVLSASVRAALIEVIQTVRVNPKIEHISISVSTRQAGTRLVDQRAAAILALFSEYRLDSSRFEVVLSDALKPRAIDVRVLK